MRALLYFVLSLIFLAPEYIQAADLTAEQLAAKVQKVYDKVPSYTADFDQETVQKLFPENGMKAGGTVAFKKPGKMHWVYQRPVTQEIISDGKTLWVYQPNDRQVLVIDADKYLKNRASITFLSGGGKLSKEFNLSIGQAPKGAATGTVLEMNPKVPDPTVNRVLLIVEPKTGLVNESWVYDFQGNATRVRFTNAKTGRKLNDKEFTFKAPPSIDVLDQRAK